jgi:tetrahydromethanopterin S-methyltransferase subunit H
MKTVNINLPKKAVIIHVPIYERPIVFCYKEKTARQALEFFEVEFDRIAAGFVASVEHEGIEGYVVAVLDGEVATASHEACHTAFSMLSAAGVPVERGDHEEAFAYLVGYLTNAFMEVINANAKAEQS